MASDANTGQIPVASLVHGSPATVPSSPPSGTGAALPAGSSGNAATAPKVTVRPGTEPQQLVDQLNKLLNDSGRPDQFRLAPSSGGKLIQQLNPANGAVIGEFSATEFPALARSVGVAGLLFDGLA